MDSINAGDTAWVLISTTLVLMMTPALAFFYGGMVRKKNVLSTLNFSFILMALISIQWVLFGFTLAFGKSAGGIIGGLNYLGLAGVGAEPNADYAGTIPFLLFAAYQMMFAVITPALITGTFVERVRFKAFLIFSLLWATLVYDPVAHWVWGVGGILRGLGALDFAGGTVVHITAGFSALAFAQVIRARRGFGNGSMEPHNIPYSVLGAGLLWMGWFGFNGGSALAANGAGSHGVGEHQHCGGRGRVRLDAAELARSQAERVGYHYRRRGGPGGHHACGRLRDPARGPGHRRGGRTHQLLRHQAAPGPPPG